MNDDAELLRRYAETTAEDAFAELVRRHLDFTWGAAYRITGDADLARDVAQTVFTDLARKAGRLPKDIVLTGWLHRAACFSARKLNRGNQRRSMREREAMSELNHLGPDRAASDANALLPRLDEALATLGEIDRNAILLRYLPGRSLAEVGNVLGMNEDAARKRVARAIEKLRMWFQRRGINATSSLLVAALGTAATQVAPSGLAATVVTTSVAGAATVGLLETLLLMKTKLALTGLAIAAVATPLTYQQVTLNRVRHENRALQERLAQAQPDEQTPGPSAVNKAELDRIQAERLELMRLRSEVARLREQAANFEAVRREIENLRARIASTPSSGVPAEGADDEAAELEKKVGIAKLNLFKSWGLAFILYADANNGRLPATLDEARPFLPATQETQENQSGLQEIDLELISHPQLNRIQHPSTTILARERTPWVNARGRFARTYVFADGHSEIRASPDGDFDAWEQERGVPAQSTGGSSPESASR